MDPARIYDALRSSIIHLDLAPESVLNISELAERFSVSRTPVKEALLALQAEEWVVRQGSHFMVTPLSLERIREITEARMVLEPQANVWAMERITPEELAGLHALRSQAQTLDPAQGNKPIVDADFEIHHTIFKATRNAQLATLLERLLSHYLRFWLATPRRIDTAVFFAEAFELIEAIEAQDEARIRQCSTHHIRNSVAEIMGTR